MAARTLFIGDVHGCLDELLALLDRVGPTPSDRVIFVGDLVNKGPDSAGVVRLVHENGWESVTGNHDAYFLSQVEKKDSFKAWKSAMGRDAFRWLATRPSWIRDDRFVAVHAGLQPGLEPERTDPRVLQNIRTWPPNAGDRARPWHHFYYGDAWVIYGHWAGQGLHRNGRTLGLDSGCVYGKELTAFVLETETLVQVRAKKVYEAVKVKK